MSETIHWLADGHPYSPRFGDRYHSNAGAGLSQAQETFLLGTETLARWSRQPHWSVLETGFGFGLNFLVTWAAWRADLKRPRLLHFVSTEAYPVSADNLLRSARNHPELLPLAEQLAQQFFGLLPGVHRLAFEAGCVLLTLAIGDAKTVLRELRFTADSVYLDGFNPQLNPDVWDIYTFKAVARCCRRGTRIATWCVARTVRDALTQTGFVVQKQEGTPPKRHRLTGEYNPHWRLRQRQQSYTIRSVLPATLAVTQAGHCLVVGAGLAGASVASSLARRGWSVTVLDATARPASGASGLPVGLFAPHISLDDSVLSQITRAGVRHTLYSASCLLRKGIDWAPSGVVEHHEDGSVGLPHQEVAAEQEWNQFASIEQLVAAGFVSQQNVDAASERSACWHSHGGWIKPSVWISALLQQAGIQFFGNCKLYRLIAERTPSGVLWNALDEQAMPLCAAADLVVIAAGYDSIRLSPMALALQAVRGQVAWGFRSAPSATLPPTVPSNGWGQLIPAIPEKNHFFWLTGSSYQRDDESIATRDSDHLELLNNLRERLPAAAAQLGNALDESHAWAGIRCVSPNRLPVVGPLDASEQGGIWICTAMGSRGLTLAALCAELLTARLHGEPLPISERLAATMASERFGSVMRESIKR